MGEYLPNILSVAICSQVSIGLNDKFDAHMQGGVYRMSEAPKKETKSVRDALLNYMWSRSKIGRAKLWIPSL